MTTTVDFVESQMDASEAGTRDRGARPARQDRGLVLGWALVVAGGLAVLIGYLGLRTEPEVLGMVPYLMSGGIVGLALICAGGIAVAAASIRRAGDRLHLLETALVALEEEMLAEFDALRAERGQAGNGG